MRARLLFVHTCKPSQDRMVSRPMTTATAAKQQWLLSNIRGRSSPCLRHRSVHPPRLNLPPTHPIHTSPRIPPPPTGSPSLSEEGNIAGRVLTRSASPSLKPNLFLEHSAIQECRHYALRRSKLTLLCRFSLRKKSNPACHQSAREVIQGLGDYVLGYVAYLQGSPCIAQVISVDRDLINIYVRRANHSAKLQLTS